jgi:hypothetical protein
MRELFREAEIKIFNLPSPIVTLRNVRCEGGFMRRRIILSGKTAANLMPLVLLLAAAAIVSGCAAQPVKLTTRFDPTEAQYINAKGKAQIAGQLFLRRNDGIVVYGAGSEVQLWPATAYARERRSYIYGGGKYHQGISPVNFEETDPEYLKFQRKAKANGEGRFLFTDVSPGTYYVAGLVTWCAPNRDGCDRQGGTLTETVGVTGATEKLDIVMDGK